ncbi:hypothetical protein LJB63_25725, partial [[Eubacterium] rectale]|nr:hypothetical protein [Agathobacter rectalis]
AVLQDGGRGNSRHLSCSIKNACAFATAFAGVRREKLFYPRGRPPEAGVEKGVTAERELFLLLPSISYTVPEKSRKA